MENEIDKMLEQIGSKVETFLTRLEKHLNDALASLNKATTTEKEYWYSLTELDRAILSFVGQHHANELIYEGDSNTKYLS